MRFSYALNRSSNDCPSLRSGSRMYSAAREDCQMFLSVQLKTRADIAEMLTDIRVDYRTTLCLICSALTAAE
jgi:hypothetical protein